MDIRLGSSVGIESIAAASLRPTPAHPDQRFVGLGAIGDVNGDALPDIAVRSGPYGFNQRMWVFVSEDGTIRETPAIEVAREGTQDIDFCTNVNGVRDVNRDGFDDFACAATGYDGQWAHVFMGRPTLSAVADDHLQLDVWRRVGAPPYATMVAGVGDVDGDTYPENGLGSAFVHHVNLFRGGPAGPQATGAYVITTPQPIWFGAVIANAE